MSYVDEVSSVDAVSSVDVVSVLEAAGASTSSPIAEPKTIISELSVSATPERVSVVLFPSASAAK